MRASIPASAFVASIVGFGGTLALIIAAAQALHASEAQTASWVTAICLALVAETGWLSWRYRMPVIAAWSTPGAALIGVSSGFTMNDAVGAFIVAALMLLATGLFKPLTRLIARIPASVASGMLAGIVVGFVTDAVKTIPADPAFILPLIALFLLVRLFNPALSVLAVLILGAIGAYAAGRIGVLPAPTLSTLTFTAPHFSIGAMFGLAVPLYLVTMASQNLSGLAVLRAAGYDPPPGPLVAVTGFFSAVSAPFGAHSTNLSAISAAICTGPESHPDPAKRWLTGPFYAFFYLVYAIFGASLVALFAVLPQDLIVLVAGLALLASLANALSIALADEGDRTAAITSFAVTASGLTLLGIGSAFWGLAAGIAVLGLDLARNRWSSRPGRALHLADKVDAEAMK
ncbi:MAG TPA: benzoate/H(+) symporter BenE family transporter [Rhizobiaceae bacterium]|nr:benzoate/H(+) symporter BenE family transporter [Rhizobiaceae bacterium]